jgi:translocation and assembly module TamA
MRINLFILFLLMALLLSSFDVRADTLELDVDGLEDAALVDNVKAHIGSKWVSSSNMSSQRRRDRFLADAETRAAKALRPYGYYFPEIESVLSLSADQSWRLLLTIKAGKAVVVRNLVLEVKGDGRALGDIVEWQANWSLLPGVRLNQQNWDQQKQAVLDIAGEFGYLSAAFEASRIELNLNENFADLTLVLDTGPRAVMGEIHYIQDSVKDEVLRSIPRFNNGDYYRTRLVSRFRTDLWRTGYFGEIDVTEQKHLDQDPPRVDLKVTLSERKKNTHQGTIGYGTDSQFRMQYRWQQHLLSERGDSLGMGLGWQQKNEELLLFGEYRIPRHTRSNQYWMLSSALKTEAEELDLSSQITEQGPRLLSGRVEDFSVRAGKVKLHDISWSEEQITETVYVQHLIEKSDFREAITEPEGATVFERLLLEEDDFADTSRSLALGLGLDWPVIQGKKFNTAGHHERAWLFTANDTWGSEQEFTQAYISSRWNFVFADDWKVLLRGEAGYTEADVLEIEREIGGDVLTVSVTELPFLYRFKAGGSYSVRGYGFEELSTNNIGSNHLLTASAELEYQFKQDWSLAAFYDIGNAFNHWSEPDLKAGIGVGLRWYTIAGAIRVDIAQAQDIDGKPWQFHLTIGTPLL